MATKTNRNETCPCGSGKKYKKCCLAQPAPTKINLPNGNADLLQTGLQHQQAGRLAQAEQSYRQILQTNPEHPDALHFLGLIAHQLGKHDVAISLISKAITVNPSNPIFYNNLGIAFKEQAQFGQAILNYEKALALKPDYAQAFNNIGAVQKEQGELDAAISSFQKALALDPNYIEAHSNLGTCYKEQHKFGLAAQCQERAIALDPGYAPAYNNLGRVYEAAGELGKAINCYRQAIAIKPDYVDLQHNLALLLLTLGEFDEGWRHYESRYHPDRKNPNTVPPTFPFQQWQGEPLHGKSLLVWPEQGFGDEIQFNRYIPILKAKGAKLITLVCKKPLKPLFSTLAGVDQLIAASDGETIGRHDYWTFPLSIPLHCQTTLDTIPVYPNYLSALPERVSYWLPKIPAAKLRVGLVWKGSSLHKNDANRSIGHLNMLAPIWGLSGIAFVSLQKGQGEDEVDGLPLTHLGSDIRDFADTAAIVSQLDLIICVDTVIAHLAGALGKPVWVMLPFAADWRWLQNREDSPWYPRTTLFRQASPGDWAGIFVRVRGRLQAMSRDNGIKS